MSLSLLNRFRRNISLRLTLWYAGVSFFAYVVIFGFVYYSFYLTLKETDDKEITSIYQKYKSEYEREGLEGLQELLELQRSADKPFDYFIRLSDTDNQTLLISIPDDWKGDELLSISRLNITSKSQNIRHNQSIFEVTTFLLQDEVMLQIGKDISIRKALLEKFINIFTSVTIPVIFISLFLGYIMTFKALKPIRDITKTVSSIVASSDVRARVSLSKTNDELAELVLLFNKMLERIEALINAMKDSLDMVAHDLRTPMMRIRGMAEDALLLEAYSNACKEALSDCLEEIERVLKMLNTLMDISEAKAGTLNLQRESIDIVKIVQETVEVYSYVAVQKGIDVRVETSIKDAISLADPNRMRQVIGNLLDNAIKYTLVGGSVIIKMFKNDLNEIAIQVSDTGTGIDQKDLPKIWDRLYRSPQSQTERGMGLGLSLVKSIVELHNGRVEVASELGKGSSFTIYLPFAR